jgi:hypothetical protein
VKIDGEKLQKREDNAFQFSGDNAEKNQEFITKPGKTK